MPDTVLALITARIDTLDAERKALLYDAAVVGKVLARRTRGNGGARTSGGSLPSCTNWPARS